MNDDTQNTSGAPGTHHSDLPGYTVEGGHAASGFRAHSPDPANGIPPHLLKVHLREVARLAVQNGEDFDIPQVAALLLLIGILHDLGKYKFEFQRERLGYDPITDREVRTSGVRVDHSSLGAVVTHPRRDFGSPAQKSARIAVSRVIAAHHAGLVDKSPFQDRIEEQGRDHHRGEALHHASTELPELLEISPTLDQIAVDLPHTGQEFLTRMLLSCLVDADHTDTEAHCSPGMGALRARPMAGLEELLDHLNLAQARFDSSTPINGLRREMYDQAVEASHLRPGFFRLTMPTGAGKTRTSLAFALRHALRHGLKRVIYAIPYTSIIDQTAEEFRKIMKGAGAHNVLEHHSALDPARHSDDDTALQAKLLSESWNAPLIVTTTVQLFESLFSNRPSQVRKLHNIAGSVIVLDEVQALPTPLLLPILDALNELVTRYRVSVVLCTATQPALDSEAGFEFPELNDIRDIIQEPERYFRALERVEYDLDIAGPTAWRDVAARMHDEQQSLCIVNVRRHAQELFRELLEQDPHALHLSTNLYPAHRRELLATIRQRLNAGEACRVVSTQLIECGVDVDFPSVSRALGPLDAIVQAAGRCNREGKLADANGNPIKGQVWVFEPEDAVIPKGDYLLKVEGARRALRATADLNSPTAFRQYFSEVYRNAATDAKGIQRLREDFDFGEVAREFRLIDTDTVPVVITRMSGASGSNMRIDLPTDLLAALESGEGTQQRDLWRTLQLYSVNVFRAQLKELGGYLRQVTLPDGTQLELYEWMGIYDHRLGIVTEANHELYVV